MDEVTIRRYEPADHDEVWALHNLALEAVNAHGGNGPWDDDLHRVEEVYLRSGGEFLVGLLGGRLVAMGALKPSAGGRAEIRRMRVHPDFQRRGFGRAILRRLEARAAELGYAELHLETTAGQTAARGLYEAMGYRETGQRTMGRFEVIAYRKRLSH